MFAVLWSEHCSYKTTKHLLRTLPTTGAKVLQGPGETPELSILVAAWPWHLKSTINHPMPLNLIKVPRLVGGILR